MEILSTIGTIVTIETRIREFISNTKKRNNEKDIENIEEDMAAAEKIIRRKFVRLEDFELMHIKRKLLSDDWGIVQAIFRILSEQAIDSIRKTSLMLQDEVFFLRGDYMDEIKADKVCY